VVGGSSSTGPPSIMGLPFTGGEVRGKSPIRRRREDNQHLTYRYEKSEVILPQVIGIADPPKRERVHRSSATTSGKDPRGEGGWAPRSSSGAHHERRKKGTHDPDHAAIRKILRGEKRTDRALNKKINIEVARFDTQGKRTSSTPKLPMRETAVRIGCDVGNRLLHSA